MSISQDTKTKLSLVALILMIFTSVYGFNNIPRAFFKMGYGAIPWYIIGGIAFFLPFAFMVTELGSAFKNEKGGIYSWMEKSVNPTYAFIGTFMWYTSYIIWMVSICSTIMVPLSNVIFGTTKIPSTLIMSIFGILWILAATKLSLKGLKQISKFSTIGGISVLALNGVLLLGALFVFAKNGFTPATEITLNAFVSSPNPNFQPSLVAFIAFIVYAIFAYGGAEAVGGLVDQTKEPEKNFHKGVVFAALVITVGYSLMILMVGLAIDYQGEWASRVVDGSLNLGNAGYAMMENLGLNIGKAMGLSTDGAIVLGHVFARITGLSLLLSLTGAFFTLLYAPLKQIIEGTPAKIWPGKLGVIEDGMPKFAMKVQCGIVITIITLNAILSLANKGLAELFFEAIVNMTNISMTLPYLFIIVAYCFFKNNDSIEKPFVIFKTKKQAKIVIVSAGLVVAFANIFSIIQPIVEYAGITYVDARIQKEAFGMAMRSAISMVMGPIIFGLIAYFLMGRYKKISKKA